MRNYMFRGFTPNGSEGVRIKYNSKFWFGDWHFGGYFFNDDGRYIVDRYTGVIENVLPETVTQYVDRVDKNDKFIFEKDIVEDDYGRVMVVVWNGNAWCFKLIYCPSFKQQLAFDGSLSLRRWDSKYLNILGNIWDLDLNRFSERRG